jgi:hypothetical protein
VKSTRCPLLYASLASFPTARTCRQITPCCVRMFQASIKFALQAHQPTDRARHNTAQHEKLEQTPHTPWQLAPHNSEACTTEHDCADILTDDQMPEAQCGEKLAPAPFVSASPCYSLDMSLEIWPAS